MGNRAEGAVPGANDAALEAAQWMETTETSRSCVFGGEEPQRGWFLWVQQEVVTFGVGKVLQ